MRHNVLMDGWVGGLVDGWMASWPARWMDKTEEEEQTHVRVMYFNYTKQQKN